MIEVTAKLNFLRISPRKVRLVVDLVRGKKALRAVDVLSILNKKSSEPVKKLLLSAIANAKHHFNLVEDSLKITKIIVNEGPTIKRWMPRARGKATMIRKRTAHINMVLTGEEGTKVRQDMVKKKEIKNK